MSLLTVNLLSQRDQRHLVLTMIQRDDYSEKLNRSRSIFKSFNPSLLLYIILYQLISFQPTPLILYSKTSFQPLAIILQQLFCCVYQCIARSTCTERCAVLCYPVVSSLAAVYLLPVSSESFRESSVGWRSLLIYRTTDK